MAKKKLEVTITGDAKGLNQAFGQADKAGSGFGTKMAAVGAKIAKAFAVAGIAAGIALVKIGSDFNDAYNTIRVGTGATGEALDGLKDDFKAVLSSVPASMGDASTAIADLNTRLGLTGPPLQDLSKQFLELSRITDTDLAGNVDRLTRVFGDWQVEAGDMPDTLDKVFRASQASGIGIDQLSGSVVQFGAPLRNLGFGLDESLALLAQFNKTGVNTETVFAGLKAGVGKLAKEGEPIPETFRRIVDEITAMGPGTEATALAIELFGQRAGPDLADAIAGGKFEIDAMYDAIANGSDTIEQAGKDTMTLGDHWRLFMNKVMVKIEPLATRVFGALISAMEKVGPVVSRLVRDARPFVDDVMAKISELMPKVQSALAGAAEAMRPFAEAIGRFVAANPTPVIVGLAAAVGLVAIAMGAMAIASHLAMIKVYLIIAAVALLVGGLVWAYQNVDWFRIAVDTMAAYITGTVIPALSSFWGWLQNNVAPVLILVASYITGTIIPALVSFAGFIRDEVIPRVVAIATAIWDTAYAVGNAVNEIVGFIAGIAGRIAGAVSTMWNGITGGIEAARDIVSGAVDAIVGFVTGIPGRIAGGLGSIASLIAAPFAAAFSGVVSLYNNTIGRLPGVGQVGGGTGIASALFGGIGQGGPFGGHHNHHTGGTFRSPTPGGEGLAILRDREQIVTPGRAAQRDFMYDGRGGVSGGDTYITVSVEGSVTSERDLVRSIADGLRREQALSPRPLVPGLSGP